MVDLDEYVSGKLSESGHYTRVTAIAPAHIEAAMTRELELIKREREEERAELASICE